jgi:hypothetical protein
MKLTEKEKFLFFKGFTGGMMSATHHLCLPDSAAANLGVTVLKKYFRMVLSEIEADNFTNDGRTAYEALMKEDI